MSVMTSALSSMPLILLTVKQLAGITHVPGIDASEMPTSSET
jgi:hypothetical protein